MKWIEIKIKTTTEGVDIVSNVLYEAGITGVAIEDPSDPIFTSKLEGNWDYFDEAILDFEFEGAIVKGYIPQDDALTQTIEIISESLNILKNSDLNLGLCELNTKEVDDEDWANEWKKYYKPTKITNKIVIKPSWEEYEPTGDEIVIEMNPGGAFGTGTHETTKMCAKFVEAYIKDDMQVFDIGCGSGILAIIAAKLGSNDVIAVDIDQAAIDASNENVAINHVLNQVDVRKGNLLDVVDTKADMVIANIVADVIIFLADDVKNVIKEGGFFVASGIINSKLADVLEALDDKGFEVVTQTTEGEWSAVVSKLR